MGLPMYRSPSPDGGDKPKTKADATAVSRSSIRRQPVRQFGIFRTSYAGLPRFNPRSDSPEDAEDRDDLFEWRPSPGSSHDLPQPTFAPRSGALNDIRREMGERLLRESLGRARPGNWLAAQNTSRATPDSPTGPEIQRSWRAPPTPDETRDSSHRQPDGPVLAQSPSPVPQDSTGIASGSYPPGHDDGWPELEPSPEDLPTTTGAFSSWTDGFAPAHPVDRTDALREPSPEAMAHASLPDWYVAESAEVSRPSADLLDSLPPLRRVGHRQVSNANLRSNVDGLGDRQRSPSDEGETDLWESMFTTVIPDQNLPSADSSFTSTASRVLSGNTSRSSRTTINTPTTSFSERPGDVSFGTSAPRRRTPHRPGSPGCDIPEGASDTEPERFTDDTPRARRRVVRPISHRQSPVDGGTSRRSADSNGNRRNPRTESDHDLLRFIRTNGVLRAGTSTHYPHTSNHNGSYPRSRRAADFLLGRTTTPPDDLPRDSTDGIWPMDQEELPRFLAHTPAPGDAVRATTRGTPRDTSREGLTRSFRDEISQLRRLEILTQHRISHLENMTRGSTPEPPREGGAPRLRGD